MCDAQIIGATTFYTNANKSEKAGYKPEDFSKVEPCTSVQKLE